ncbi:MAG: DNA-processing protein DprA [bacterium]|nr:DNA-processing protein DprA [bacterium]
MTDTKTLSENERIAWAAWACVPQVGAKRITLLLETFGDLTKAWHANNAEIRNALQMTGKTFDTILEGRRKLDPQKNWEKLVAANIHVVTIVDEDYPALLKEIHNAPAVLFYRGTLPRHNDILVAVVGTRVATSYGRTVTPLLVEPLARAGVGIVSGMALGIDGMAHEAALAAGGKTYAIVGTGLDLVYPPQHAELADRIVKAGGAIISEFPLGIPPLAQNFPQRNRIVAGMCAGTLVVEAGEKSGALLTAKLALDENREVFCVPGNITQETSRGTNKFIRLGAQLVTDTNGILTALNLLPDDAQTAKQPPYAGDTPEEKIILKHLCREPIHVDELSGLCDCDPSVINATLVVLELQGHVRNVGGMHYTLA